MLNLRSISSIAELRAAAPAWDDLWQRSDVAAPTARAELIALWLEHFAPRAAFLAIVVEDDGRFVAALPLVNRRLKGLVDMAALPGSNWSAAGTLLVDPACSQEALELLVRSLRKLDWPLIWLDGVNRETPAWQRLLSISSSAGVSSEHRVEATVGWIDVDSDWTGYLARRPKSLRRNLERTRRGLAQEGELQFARHDRLRPEHVPQILRQAFEVEERSWKAAAGTSVMRAGVFEFFTQQATQLAQWGLLEISLLCLAGQPIAFGYGYRGKETYFLHKVGYDERYARFGPGQLLMQDLLQSCFADARVQSIDMLGPMTDAVGRWTTASYQEGRLFLAPDRMVSRFLMRGFRTWRAARSL